MRIAFFDSIGWDYNVDSPYRRPLGGSHSAACYLAEALARAGHQVFYCNATQSPGLVRGVHCVCLRQSTERTLQDIAPDCAILILNGEAGAQLRGIYGPRVKLVLWTQHADDQPEVQMLRDPAQRDLYDGIALASNWQRGRFRERFGLDPLRTAVFRNGVSPAFLNLFPEGQSFLQAKTRPPILAYTSTPFRGLDVLLDVFPHIRRAAPDVRLQVFSSMQVYNESIESDRAAYGRLYDRCRQTDGVEYVGTLPQPQLAAALRQVSILAYPSTFAETFCISAIEAMAAGCRLVTSDLGALPETTAGFARLVRMDSSGKEFHERFIEQAVEAIREREPSADAETGERISRQIAYVQSHCQWDILAEEWTRWLERLPA